jgi:hypothetical protein
MNNLNNLIENLSNYMVIEDLKKQDINSARYSIEPSMYMCALVE